MGYRPVRGRGKLEACLSGAAFGRFFKQFAPESISSGCPDQIRTVLCPSCAGRTLEVTVGFLWSLGRDAMRVGSPLTQGSASSSLGCATPVATRLRRPARDRDRTRELGRRWLAPPERKAQVHTYRSPGISQGLPDRVTSRISSPRQRTAAAESRAPALGDAAVATTESVRTAGWSRSLYLDIPARSLWATGPIWV